MNKYSIFRISCFIASIFLLVIGFLNPIFWLSIGLLVIFYAIIVSIMSMSLRANFFLTATHHMPNNQVMLTFDDGPHPEHTLQILDILNHHNIKAMFFLVGTKAQQYPEIVKRIVAENHLIGGHTLNHKYTFGLLSTKRVKNEIVDGMQEISHITGYPVSYFRPPFGVTNPNIAKVVKDHDFCVIGWSVRSFDTVFSDSNKLKKRMLKKIMPGKIVLFHDTQAATTEVLSEIIGTKQKEGVIFEVLHKI